MHESLAWLVVVAMSASFCSADTNDTDPIYSSEQLLLETFNSIRNFSHIAVGDLEGADVPAVLSRLQQMPNLVTLEFHNCDLSNVDEQSPVSEGVTTILIANGKISQGTMRWLAKFPAGRQLAFGGLDMRGIAFDLGEFAWLTFDNCQVPRSAVLDLIETASEVTFKEVTLVDDRWRGNGDGPALSRPSAARRA